MTQEGLFRDLKVFIENVLEQKLEEKLEQKLEEKLDRKLDEKLDLKLDQKLGQKFEQTFSHFTQEIQGEFTDIRYNMADMQMSINSLDEKVDQVRVDIARLSKRDGEDIKALGNDIFSLKKRVTKLEGKTI